MKMFSFRKPKKQLALFLSSAILLGFMATHGAMATASPTGGDTLANRHNSNSDQSGQQSNKPGFGGAKDLGNASAYGQIKHLDYFSTPETGVQASMVKLFSDAGYAAQIQ